MANVISLFFLALGGWEIVGAIALLIPVFVFVLWAPIQLVRDALHRRERRRLAAREEAREQEYRRLREKDRFKDVDENGIPYL